MGALHQSYFVFALYITQTTISSGFSMMGPLVLLFTCI